MARSIFECKRAKYLDAWCVLAKLEVDKSGTLRKIPGKRGCYLCLEDEYNIYPEHNNDGTIVYNKEWNSTDPFPSGINVIWENDTAHETGLSFNMDCRKRYRSGTVLRSRTRPEDYNCHPLYTIRDINEPFITGGMGNEHIGYTFGENDIAISPSGWREQIIRGKERWTQCQAEIYARYDPAEGIVFPNCLKDWSGEFKNWVNYTVFPTAKRRKTFFPCEEEDKVIIAKCIEWFGDTTLAKVMAEAMMEIKAGEFINLRDLMRNNGISDRVRKKIMTSTSVRSLNSIYKKMTSKWYYLYYRALDKMGLPKGKVRVYKANLLNYILNYPPLSQIDPENPPLERRKSVAGLVPTSRRYWWVCRMVKDAWEEGKRTGQPILYGAPDWLITQHKFLKRNRNHLYKELEGWNPAVVKVSEIVNTKSSKGEWKKKKRLFTRILLAGQRWNYSEIKETWRVFSKNYDDGTPTRFWSWIEAIKLATPGQLDHLVQEGEITISKAFAWNLLEAMVNKNSFRVRETLIKAERGRFIRVSGVQLCPYWFFTKGKPGWSKVSPDGRVKAERSEAFFMELRRVWFAAGKKGENLFEQYRELIASLPAEQAEELLRNYREEAKHGVMMGTEFGPDDLNEMPHMNIIDLDGLEEEAADGRTQWEEERLESQDFFRSYPMEDESNSEDRS